MHIQGRFNFIRKTRFAKTVFAFVGLVFLFLAFQNCVPSNLTSVVTSVTDLKLNGGNGEPYDGKPGFIRLVPGLTCADNQLAVGNLEIQGDTAWVTTNENSCVGDRVSVPVSSLERSTFTSQYVGYEGGVYTYTSNPQTRIEQGIFTEAWCRVMNSDKSASLLEIAVEWNSSEESASLTLMDEKQPDPNLTRAHRQHDLDRVSYSNGDGTLDIYFQKQIAGSRKVPGYFTGSIDGAYRRIAVECLMGGQFDPIAPTFEYSSSTQRTLKVGQPLLDLIPALNKKPQRFEIKGDLPKGLQFSTSTGAVSGQALEPSARQSYQISAVFSFGRVSKQVSIAVGKMVRIDRLVSDTECQLDSTGCDLQSAVALANAIKPLPLVAEVTVPRIQLNGKSLVLSGDLSVLGGNAEKVLLDAQSLSAHWDLQAGGHLELERLQLMNGKSGYGGSIKALNASLVLRNLRFENNQAVTVPDRGQGGAIFADGSKLEVFNSEFIRNKTSLNGSLIGGGAIGIQNGKSTVIRDCQFISNEAQMGGALYFSGISSAIHQVSGSVFNSNSAMDGGAIHQTSGLLSVDHSRFEKNTAIFDGGAISFLISDKAWIQDSEFIANSGMSTHSPGIRWSGAQWGYMPSPSVLYILESKFRDHKAITSDHSGTLLVSVGQVVLRGTSFQSQQTGKQCLSIAEAPYGEILSLGGNESSDQSCPQ